MYFCFLSSFNFTLTCFFIILNCTGAAQSPIFNSDLQLFYADYKSLAFNNLQVARVGSSCFFHSLVNYVCDIHRWRWSVIRELSAKMQLPADFAKLPHLLPFYFVNFVCCMLVLHYCACLTWTWTSHLPPPGDKLKSLSSYEHDHFPGYYLFLVSALLCWTHFWWLFSPFRLLFLFGLL